VVQYGKGTVTITCWFLEGFLLNFVSR
jgi:hypothetical protein